jgi:hypothetical protein
MVSAFLRGQEKWLHRMDNCFATFERRNNSGAPNGAGSYEHVVQGPAVRWRLLPAIDKPVVTHDRRDAQAIILEDSIPPYFLSRAVSGVATPPGDGDLVPPERNRQKLFGIGQALESLDGYETVHIFQLGS